MSTSVAATEANTHQSQLSMDTEFGRILVGIIPAGIVTVGLFLGMRAVIEIEGFSPDSTSSYELIAYYVPKFTEGPTVRKRKPLKTPKAVPPPRVAPPVGEVISTVFTLPSLMVPEPRLRETGRPFRMALGPVAINNRDLRPLQPPMVVYPQGQYLDNLREIVR